MNSLVIVLLIYNKLDHLEEELVLLPEVLHLIGVVTIQSKKDMLEVQLLKVGLHLLLKIGLITEQITKQLIKTQLLLVKMLIVMQIAICTLKIVYLTHLVTHGVKLMVKMPFLTQPLMLIILDMVLYPVVLIHTLIIMVHNQYLK